MTAADWSCYEYRGLELIRAQRSGVEVKAEVWSRYERRGLELL